MDDWLLRFTQQICFGGQSRGFGVFGVVFSGGFVSLWQQNCVFLKTNLRRPFSESLTNRIQIFKMSSFFLSRKAASSDSDRLVVFFRTGTGTSAERNPLGVQDSKPN